MFPRPPIMFLDFDGVVCTTEAYVAFRQWDNPVAFGLIKKLCMEQHCEIVVTSTWRNGSRALPMLAAHHLLDHLHEDWRVEAQNESRSRAILNWQKEHPDSVNYIIVDDERCDYTDEQKKWFIHTNMDHGFSLNDFVKAEHYLKKFDYSGKLGQAYGDKPKERPLRPDRVTLATMAKSAKQAIEEGDLESAIALLDNIKDHPLAD